jgi:hypothetical protein
MKIELSIKTTYLPTWGQYEAIRELLQNGRDAEVELSAPMTVRHRKDANILVIENEGCVLPHEALLLGHTTKVERSDLIGKFGEGLKLALLVLARSGQPVKIRSGSEVWVPSIQKSERFNADVLVMDISSGRKSENRVQVEVGNISAEDWEAMKKCFLFLLKPREIEKNRIEGFSGALLLGDEYKGKLFAKGIFVQNDPRLHYGYDLSDVELDRDRKMIDKYTLQYKCQSIWREALGKRPDLIENFTRMLDQEATDLDGVDNWAANYLPQKAKEAIVQNFKARHGEDAVPVGSLADSKDIEHLGKSGIVAPKALKAVLESMMGTAETIKQNLRNEAIKTYSWGELSVVERDNLEWAIGMVNAVTPTTLDKVDVSDFRDEKIQGLFKDSRVVLARLVLADRMEALRVLVHEVAHDVSNGGDGDKSHISSVERIWAGIVASLVVSVN